MGIPCWRKTTNKQNFHWSLLLTYYRNPISESVFLPNHTWQKGPKQEERKIRRASSEITEKEMALYTLNDEQRVYTSPIANALI